jgi:hypothetical protein
MTTDVTTQRFMQLMEMPGGTEKTAQAISNYIRDKLREDSFLAQILPPEDVTPDDCQVSTEHDTIVKIVEVEQQQDVAMPITFRGGHKAQFIRGPRVAVPFYTIMSPMFEKTEQELLAYQMPLTKLVERNAIKDIELIQDYVFLGHIEQAVQAVQTAANGGVGTALATSNLGPGGTVEASVNKGEGARNAAVDDLTVHPIIRPDFPRIMKILNSTERKPATLLITDPDYTDILQWTITDLGNRWTEGSLENGLALNTLFGMKYVRTIKVKVLRIGNVYVFTEPDFLGKFYVLNKIKFYLDKEVNRIRFCAWEDIGSAIINVASIGKLELYSANVQPDTAAAADLAAKTPVSFDDLGTNYNRVEAGDYFPHVHLF